MKKLLLVLVVAIAAYFGYVQQHPRFSEAPAAGSARNDSVLAKAIENHASHIQVQGQGLVAKILADDNEGSRHQRFVVRLSSGQTILIAHNIDIAQRIASLSEGDVVEFNGQYEWNARGGVVHWTHHDPADRHPGGWLKHNGKTFQ